MGSLIVRFADRGAEAFIISGATTLALAIWGHSWMYVTKQSLGEIISPTFAKQAILFFTIERCAFYIIQKTLKPTLTEESHVRYYTLVAGLSISSMAGLVTCQLLPLSSFEWVAGVVALYALTRLTIMFCKEGIAKLPHP